MLFAKKADGSLCLCVDYRGLNDGPGMIKNCYPLPLLRDTLLRLQKAKYYTKLDVRSAYNLIRIAEGEEWKTAFRTRYGLFESLVMPFGLTNAPASFQNFINDVLCPFLDLFVTAYLDDILIFSSTLKEHKQHVRQVLTRLQENSLHLAPHKCEFHRTSVKYLGFIINTKGCAPDPAKITTVVEWGTKPEPDSTPAKAHKPAFGNVTNIHRFLGFANFNRRFIKDYSRISAPLTRLTRNEIPFMWNDDCTMAVETLKTAFTTAPVLHHFDRDIQIIVETDASDFISAGVLSQYDDDGILHPVAFFTKKHSPVECNYEIYDKELMMIIRYFEEWRPELEEARHPIQILSDHRNLEYFMTTKLLNRRQTYWAEFLSRFDFKIVYRPAKVGGKPDALTRRTEDLPGDGDERLLHMECAVLKSNNLPAELQPTSPKPCGELNLRLLADNLPSTPPLPPTPPLAATAHESPQDDTSRNLTELIATTYAANPFPAKVLRMLANSIRQCRHILLSECSRDANGIRLRYHSRLYVPEYNPLRLRLLQTHHKAAAAGHPGQFKSLELLKRTYF